MENVSGLGSEDEKMELPPGFRFHPTDEELITHYLGQKVLDQTFCPRAIGEVDLNKVEPWDLPWRAKMGEKEWYFFCARDRKYPTGSRTNRATDAGYWKATGKDREIFRGRKLVGMKKTLVFYKGRAPSGAKTNWVIHEFRLEGKSSMKNLPEAAKNKWVISRVFRKSSGGKKTHISGLVSLSSYSDELRSSNLPPLMDLSPYDGQTSTVAESSHVTCFSNSMEDQIPQGAMGPSSSSKTSDISNSSLFLSKGSATSSFFSTQLEFDPHVEILQFSDSFLMQNQSTPRLLLENNGTNLKQHCKAEFSHDTGLSTDLSSALSNHEMDQRFYEDEHYPITSAGPVDLDCLWDF
ncbi:unnamed protein product [Ilex paraguariensis]|uniref:NAC domain-containing protein n=1 Tax=Ilex paraguariensis TaxID=185542 RepID=A0ABC8T0N2_9AQUA